MRRPARGWGVACAVAVAAAACAHIEAPTGGPEDRQGPQLLVTRPDTFARTPALRTPAVFVFDEAVAEQNLEAAISVSPRTSAVSVENDGDEVRVSLRRGWEPNRIYQVVLDSTVADRLNNRIAEPIRLVFSTGPAIPETFLSGTVLERQTGAPAAGVRVEAILRPDSLVYATRTDAQGTFAFAQIPEGQYQVRAFNDPNANRTLEGFEARDTTVAAVAAGRQPAVALSIVAPDTTAPRALEGTPADSSVTVRFDDFLDPTQALTPAQVRLLAPDSTPVRVAAVALESAAAAPADTGAARAPAQPQRGGVTRDTARAPARDTARARGGPVPGRTLVVRLAVPLRPETEYTLRVQGVRNLVGLAGGGTVRFRTPRATPPAPAAGAAQTPPAPAPGTPQAPPPAAPAPPSPPAAGTPPNRTPP